MHVPLDELESYLEQERARERNLDFFTSLPWGEEILVSARGWGLWDTISVRECKEAPSIGKLMKYSNRHLSLSVEPDWKRKGVATLIYNVRSALFRLPELETTGRLDRFLFLLKMGYVPRWIASTYAWGYHKQSLGRINYEGLLYGEFVEKFPNIRKIYPEYVPFLRKMFWITEKNLGAYCVMGYSPEEALEFAQKIGFIGKKDSDHSLPKK